MKASNEHLIPQLQVSGPMLYHALLTIVRQNAQGHPIGHDAFVNARRALAIASGRPGEKIDWAKEPKL